jgi:RNA polymerase sigma factor (sigma-70 family)
MNAHRGEDFEEFFRRVYPSVLRATIRVAGATGVAEDAAIEAMTKAFVRWPRLRSLPYRDAWVLRVAINETLRQLRRDRVRDLVVSSGAVAGPADAVAIRLVVVAAVARLPRRQREAIGLRYLGDRSEADTAAAMGVSGGTLKSHLDRARRSLRASLGDELVKELLRADP